MIQFSKPAGGYFINKVINPEGMLGL